VFRFTTIVNEKLGALRNRVPALEQLKVLKEQIIEPNSSGRTQEPTCNSGR
jgi:hypothetical protein